MSGLSWLEWVFRDGRRFDSPAIVVERVEENLSRLRILATGPSAAGEEAP